MNGSPQSVFVHGSSIILTFLLTSLTVKEVFSLKNSEKKFGLMLLNDVATSKCAELVSMEIILIFAFVTYFELSE